MRICRAGGVIVLTVKDALWTGGFAARVKALQSEGLHEVVELTEPYLSMPGEAATTPSRAVVLRVLNTT